MPLLKRCKNDEVFVRVVIWDSDTLFVEIPSVQGWKRFGHGRNRGHFHLMIRSVYGPHWFDFNTLPRDIPKTSKVLDQIFEESQFLILDSLRNKMNNTKDGYRLQIYDAMTVTNANKTLKNRL